MFLIFILSIVFSCYITYKIVCYKFIKLDKYNCKEFDIQQKYICKALDEIAKIRVDVNKIKKDIYQ